MDAINNDLSKGNFIVFEGIDGSGKSSQIRLLMQKLKTLNIKCYETKEPTDGPVGSLIHQFMTGRIKTDDKVIAALFVADRLDHLLNTTDGIVEKINNGVSVISDRYYISSYAYHGVSLPMEWVINANSVSADILRPKCHVFIDVPPQKAIERVKMARFHTELYESYERLVAVRDNYLKAIELLKDVENIVIINGAQSEQDVSAEIWEKISNIFTSGE